ncbi:hypothetical protein, partial [Enterobacter hormaechei]|uniref:hypothetical protein n=1 Tax=Enterobacter hormaechei TaxID=158836 RepID=UPI003BF68EAF
ISSYRVEKASKYDGRRPGRRAPVSPREKPGRLRLPERNFAAPAAPRTLLSIVSRCCPGMCVLSGISSCKADR